jgi:hypothetical protein
VDSKDTKRIQEVLGALLYYARAVDCTMIPAIGSIATQQANATKATMKAITQLLNYCATHPDAVVPYYASDMVLYIESDASYLSETKARSRAAGYHYHLSNHPPHPDQPPAPTDPSPPMNGAIVVPCKVMREVLSSASEAEEDLHRTKDTKERRRYSRIDGEVQDRTPDFPRREERISRQQSKGICYHSWTVHSQCEEQIGKRTIRARYLGNE